MSIEEVARRAVVKLRPVFAAMERSERRVDYANGCRCDRCITVFVEDTLLAEPGSPIDFESALPAIRAAQRLPPEPFMHEAGPFGF